MKIYIAGHRGIAGSGLVHLMAKADLAMAEREKKIEEAGGSGSGDA